LLLAVEIEAAEDPIRAGVRDYEVHELCVKLKCNFIFFAFLQRYHIAVCDFCMSVTRAKAPHFYWPLQCRQSW
jgi:methyl coenzyme M reductase gamma subunit